MADEGLTFKFLNTQNGCVLEMTNRDGVIERLCYQDSDDDSQDIERFRDFLCAIKDYYGPTTSRYSKARIYITIAPGDKADDL